MKTNRLSRFTCLAALAAQTAVWLRRCWRVWAFDAEVLSQDIEREIGRLPRVTGFAQQHWAKR